MLQVKKSKRGIDNILGLLRYTFPKVTRVVTPSHITVASRPIGDPPGDHNMELTVTGISETTTGEVVLPYQAFDLTNCDCPSEIAAEMFSLTHVKAFLATKPIAIDELDFTKEGDSYRVSAVEGAFTVFGEKVFTLAEGSEGDDEEDDEPEEPEPEPEDPEETPVDPGAGDGGDDNEEPEEPEEDAKPSAQPGDWYFHEGEWYYCTVDHRELKDICSAFLNDTDPNQIRTVTRSGQSHDIPLNNIDTRYVTDMYQMFQGATNFNQNISNWDTSNVTDMQGTFSGASSFNQPIGDWDVSNVTNMQGTFTGASSFNQPIGDWDVSNVTSMATMFWRATNFNQDLSNWCVTKIKSKSANFDYDSGLTEANHPIWGTCPNG